MEKGRSMMIKAIRFVAITVAVALLTLPAVRAVSAGRSVPARAAASYEPVLDPANFVAVIDNPYFPLPVGRVMVLKGVKDGVTQVETVTVTSRTRVLEGITATAVSDVARHGKRLLEKTTDWYAQDKQGNVWYAGEATAAYGPGGQIDRSGSWRAGVNDAEPGIIMEAHPAIPDSYRQEYLKGQAEDTAWVVRVGSRAKLSFGGKRRTIVTLEATRVEPGSYDKKVYARGYGILFEESLTGTEWARLVSVRG
jgi:hypothetical protein